MSGWTKILRDIRDRHVGATGKRIVLVEGGNDRDAFGAMLDLRYPGWETKWAFEPADGKQNVTAILAVEPGWIGVVDHDEWTDADVAHHGTTHPNLWVLPRFCLESYLIAPGELWAVLSPTQQGKLAGGEARLRREILVDKDMWLRHGVLRSVINPMWKGLRSLGFQNGLLDFAAAQDDLQIQTTLASWHNFLNPTVAFTNFKSQLTTVLGLREEVQFRQWIYGKLFFSDHVVPVLNRLSSSSQSADEWREDLFKHMRVLPPDMDPLWQKMGLT